MVVMQTFLSAGSGDFPVASGCEHGTGMFRQPAGWKARATRARHEFTQIRVFCESYSKSSVYAKTATGNTSQLKDVSIGKVTGGG